MTTRSLVLAIVAALLLTSPAMAGDAARRVAAEAETLLADGDFAAARRALQSLECDAADTACATLRAFSLGYLYERWAVAEASQEPVFLARAETAYNEALEHRPDNEQVRTNLALLFARQDRLADAERLMLTDPPREGGAKLARALFVGDLYAEAGRRSRALDFYARAEKLAPRSEDVHRRVFRLYRGQGEPNALFEYCRKLWQGDLDRLAVEGLELVIRAAWQDDSELADQALLHWTELRAEARTLTAADLERLPPKWTSAAFTDLRGILQASTAYPRLGWWARGPLRLHVAARVFQARAAQLRERKDLSQAAAWLEAARRAVPDVSPYEYGQMDDRTPPAIDATVDLAAVRHQLGNESGVAELVEDLFRGKSQAYLRRDDAAIQGYHTVLGLIFHEQKRWKSTGGRRYDNAIFQLQHALGAAARRGAAAEPLPGLRLRLAEAYEETGQKARAAKDYFQASMDYLDLDDLLGAGESLAKSRSTGFDRRKVAQLENVVTVRREIDAGASARFADARTIRVKPEGRSELESSHVDWLFEPEKLALDKDFLERQRFKALADLSATATRKGQPFEALYLNVEALGAAGGLKGETLSRKDVQRLEKLQSLELDQRLAVDDSVLERMRNKGP